ncbi:conserved hypothetical protein [Crenothrix polyspora]|uniref:Uncharacterized protein n=1 Tax=Crenothrix polyspora TaxID=360316 RepID=A0A1R4H3U7_9GAMM|nr:hypothetical protein [Crenothrix polyspora]SJM90904.1 conserved hypothetical protein [Crenothrix polyspora]
MSDYETQSLQIATDTLHVYFWGDVITACALLAAICGGFVAFFTLRKIAQQLESAKWNALLSFEQDMNARRNRFSDIALKVTSESAQHGASYEEAKESYLNAVERLASAILNGQFPEDEMKTSYREHITNTIREYQDKFRVGTHYPRIVKLHEKWRD